jgi:hypothetical protein
MRRHALAQSQQQHHDDGMDMSSMVRDMRDRFLIALIFSIPIVLWSPIGRLPLPKSHQEIQPTGVRGIV